MIQWAWRTCLGVLLFCVPAPAFLANAADAPVPLLEKDKPVDWRANPFEKENEGQGRVSRSTVFGSKARASTRSDCVASGAYI
jgi:hypothetical protein